MERRHPYLRIATTNRKWRRIVQQQLHTDARTPTALAPLIARVIARDALEEARQLVSDDKPAPVGDTLNDQICRRYHAALFGHKKARVAEEQRKALGDMIRQQAKAKK